MTTDIAIEAVELGYEDFRYRTPIKFGGVALDRVTILNVRCEVHTREGDATVGHGSMPLGNVWAWPSKALSYDQTLNAMKVVAERIRKTTAEYREFGHPIDQNHTLEPQYFRAANDVTAELMLAEPIPKLATLVVASAFDAAVHDAYGKAHGRSVYHCYGRDHLPHDRRGRPTARPGPLLPGDADGRLPRRHRHT